MAAVEVWTFSRRGYGYNCLITVGWAETGERDPGDIIDHVPSMHPTSVVCILEYAYYVLVMLTRLCIIILVVGCFLVPGAQRHAVGAARLASCS